MSIDRDGSAFFGSEGERRAVREFFEAEWREAGQAAFFRWNRFNLEWFEGRQEIGTTPVWYRVVWFVTIPFQILFNGLIRPLLVAADVLEDKPRRGVGTIYAAGTTRNRSAISLIDSVKRAQRPLWLVFSRSQLAVVAVSKSGDDPRVVWQTDESASLRFNHDVDNSVEVTWPDECHASFDLDPEEGEHVRRFIGLTTENERKFQ